MSSKEEAASGYLWKLETEIHALKTMMEIVMLVCADGTTDKNKVDRVDMIVRAMDQLVRGMVSNYQKAFAQVVEDEQ